MWLILAMTVFRSFLTSTQRVINKSRLEILEFFMKDTAIGLAKMV